MTAQWLNPEVWVPRRRVTESQLCDFCWLTIQRGSAGWYNPALDVWECTACRIEGQRAEMVRAAMSAPASAPQQELVPVTEEAT